MPLRFPDDDPTDLLPEEGTPHPTGEVIQQSHLQQAPNHAPTPTIEVDAYASGVAEQPQTEVASSPQTAPAYVAPRMRAPANPEVAQIAQSGAYAPSEVPEPVIPHRRFIDPRLEQRQQEHDQAIAQRQQADLQREEDKRARTVLKGLKSQGVELETDPVTGQQAPKLDDQGRPIYTPKVIQPVTQTEGGRFVKLQRDRTGAEMEVEIKPKIDPNTGEKYVEDDGVRHSLGVDKGFILRRDATTTGQQLALARQQATALAQQKKDAQKKLADLVNEAAFAATDSKLSEDEKRLKLDAIRKERDALAKTTQPIAEQADAAHAQLQTLQTDYATKRQAMIDHAREQLGLPSLAPKPTPATAPVEPKVVAPVLDKIQQTPLGFFDKLKDVASNPAQLLPFVGGAKEVYDLGKIGFAAHRLQEAANKGTVPDQADIALVKNFAERNARDTTFGYKVASVLAALPSFAGELAATGGIYTAAEKGALKAGTKALEYFGSKAGVELLGKLSERVIAKEAGAHVAGTVATSAAGKAAEFAARGGASLVGSAAQLVPASGIRIAADTMERMLPQFTFQKGEGEQLSATINKQGDDFGPALAKAFGNQYTEVMSERTGGALAFIPGADKLRLLKAAVAQKWFGIHPDAAPSAFNKFVSRVGWHGVIGEMFEERVGDVSKSAMGLQSWAEAVPSLEQLAVEAVSFSIPGVAGSIYQKARQGKQGEPPAPEADPNAPTAPVDPNAPAGAPSEDDALTADLRQAAAEEAAVNRHLLEQEHEHLQAQIDDINIPAEQKTALIARQQEIRGELDAMPSPVGTPDPNTPPAESAVPAEQTTPPQSSAGASTQPPATSDAAAPSTPASSGGGGAQSDLQGQTPPAESESSSATPTTTTPGKGLAPAGAPSSGETTPGTTGTGSTPVPAGAKKQGQASPDRSNLIQQRKDAVLLHSRAQAEGDQVAADLHARRIKDLDRQLSTKPDENTTTPTTPGGPVRQPHPTESPSGPQGQEEGQTQVSAQGAEKPDAPGASVPAEGNGSGGTGGAVEQPPRSVAMLDVGGVQKEAVHRLAAKIDNADLYTAEEGYGREDEPHVTALYGFHDQTPAAVERVLKDFGPIKAKFGKTTLFENEGSPYDVVKIDMHGEDLHRLNAELRKLPHTNDFPEYHPHLTLAYVKKGMGQKYVGANPLTGRSVTIDSATFSNAAKEKTKVAMGKTTPEETKSPEVAPQQPDTGDTNPAKSAKGLVQKILFKGKAKKMLDAIGATVREPEGGDERGMSAEFDDKGNLFLNLDYEVLEKRLEGKDDREAVVSTFFQHEITHLAGLVAVRDAWTARGKKAPGGKAEGFKAAARREGEAIFAAMDAEQKDFAQKTYGDKEAKDWQLGFEFIRQLHEAESGGIPTEGFTLKGEKGAIRQFIERVLAVLKRFLDNKDTWSKPLQDAYETTKRVLARMDGKEEAPIEKPAETPAAKPARKIDSWARMQERIADAERHGQIPYVHAVRPDGRHIAIGIKMGNLIGEDATSRGLTQKLANRKDTYSEVSGADYRIPQGQTFSMDWLKGEMGRFDDQTQKDIAEADQRAAAEIAKNTVGKNERGETIMRDSRGARSITENGITRTQSVAFVPGRGAVIPSPEEMYSSGDREYLTAEEVARFKAAEKPATTTRPAGAGATMTTLSPGAAKPKPQAKSKASDDLKNSAKEALDGLFLPPDKSEEAEPLKQEPFPKDRRAKLFALADQMEGEGITTPEEIARLLDDISEGRARKFSQALWDTMAAAGHVESGKHDWNAIYSKLDADSKQEQLTPEDQPDEHGSRDEDAGADTSGQVGDAGQNSADAELSPDGIPAEELAGGGGRKPDTRHPDGGGRGQLPGQPAGSGGSEVAGTSTGDTGSDLGSGEATGSGDGHGAAGKPADPNARNHRFGPDDQLAPKGNPAKLRANIGAIKLLKQLEKQDRNATPEEKAKLAQYTGWGQFKGAFDENRAALRGKWNEDTAWTKNWGDSHDQIRKLLTDDEWKAAAASTLNAHYTDKPEIQAMWQIAKRLGFKGGKVLESAIGVGHFYGLMPPEMAEASKLFGLDKDPVSARIAAKLYPEADIRNTAFEKAKLPNNYFDLGMSNFPFHEVGVGDARYPKLNLHNYFFARNLDLAKPGGLVIAITSNSTLDANPEQRAYLQSKGDLVAAIRLPNNAFKSGAGTEVTTDILIFRKPDGTPFQGESFLNTVQVGEERGKPIMANEYFARNPYMALGKHSLQGTQYRADAYALVADPSRPLEAALQEAIDSLPKDIANYAQNFYNDLANQDHGLATGEKEGAVVLQDGKTLQVQDSKYVTPEWATPKFRSRVRKVETRLEMARHFIGLRDKMKELLNRELQPDASDEAIEQNRTELRGLYDAYVKKFGNLEKGSLSFLEEDPEYYLVMGLENIGKERQGDVFVKKIGPADILSRRTLFPSVPPTHADNVADGARISLQYRGRIDPEYVAELTGRTTEDAERELVEGGSIFKNPATGLLEPRDLYLASNVRRKLAEAETAAKDDDAYKPNVEALRAIQPERVGFENIQARAGSAWIPAKLYQTFAQKTLGESATVEYFAKLDRWTAALGPDHSGLAENRSTYGTDRISGVEILNDVLNLRNPKVHDLERYITEGGNEATRQVLNKEETDKARAKADRLRKEFRDYIVTDEKAREEIEDTYNDVFNSYVVPLFDGSHVVFPGMASSYKGKPILLRPHQKDVVYRITQTGSALMAHGVGGGKTIAQIAAAMEMKRLGMARKPLIIVDKPTIGQFAATFRQVYPNANVLVAGQDSFTAPNRKRFMSRIATGNWDAVVMSNSQFDLMPSDPDTLVAYVQRQVDELREIAAAAEAEEGKQSKKVRQLQTEIRRLEVKMESILSGAGKRQDNTIFFEQSGIDALFLDEAHLYKKVPFVSKMDPVKGVDRNPSKRAIMLHPKILHIQEKNRGRNIVLATGTPVTNTLAEAWTMTRLVAPQLLEEWGVDTFDKFVSAFATVESSTEINAGGQWASVERLKKFTNGPELVKMIRTAWDVRMGEDLKGLSLPEIRGGKPTLVAIETTPEISHISAFLMDAYKQFGGLTAKQRKESSWVPIVTMGTGMAAATDPRLVDTRLPDNPNSLVNTAIRKIIEIHESTKANRSTQIVFLDRFRPRATAKLRAFARGEMIDPATLGDLEDENASFNLYEDIRAKLIAAGVPREEIAIASDITTEDKNLKVQEDMNAGRVRILIGSTAKIGQGINVQDKLVAAHHLDPPLQMTPAQYIQRNGRIIRDGNENAVVDVFTYGVKRSMAAGIWDRIQTKAKFIVQILMGKGVGRDFEDPADEVTMSIAEQVAELTGDRRILRKVELETQVRELNGAREAHYNNLGATRRNIASEKAEQKNLKNTLIPRAEADKKWFEEHFGEGKPLEIAVGKSSFGTIEAFDKAMETLIAGAKERAAEFFKEKPKASDARMDFNATINGMALRGEVMVNAERYNGTVYVSSSLSTPNTSGIVRTNATTGKGLIDAANRAFAARDERLADFRKQLETAGEQIRKMTAELDAVFTQQDELNAKTAELAKLDSELLSGTPEAPADLGAIELPTEESKPPGWLLTVPKTKEARESKLARIYEIMDRQEKLPEKKSYSTGPTSNNRLLSQLRDAAAKIELEKYQEAKEGRTGKLRLPPDRAEYQGVAASVWLEHEKTPAQQPAGDEATRILASYRQATEKSGFPAVSIADVLEGAGFTLAEADRAKGVLVSMLHSGEVTTFSAGDWSLADFRKRAWGLNTMKRTAYEAPSLMVRMNAGAKLSAPPDQEGDTQPSSNSVDILKAALATLPPQEKKVLTMRINGKSDTDIAKATKLSPAAVNTAYQIALGKMRRAKERARSVEGIRQEVKTEPPGERTMGRPDLANPGKGKESRLAQDAVDEARNRAGIPSVRHDVDVERQALDRIAGDFEGEKTALLKRAQDGGQLNDVETVIAKRIVGRGLLNWVRQKTDNAILEGVMLADAWRVTGSEQARAFRQRRDAILTPAQRLAEFVGEAIMSPDAKRQKALDTARKNGDQKKREEILKDWAKQIEKMKERLKQLGIDLDTMTEADFRTLSKNPVKAAKLLRNIQQAKGDTFDQVYEYWVASVLSGVGSNAANIAGNVANAAWDFSLQRMAEAVVNLAVRDPRSASFGEFRYLLRGVAPGWTRAARNMVTAWGTENPVFEEDVLGKPGTDKLEMRHGAIPGKLGRVIRTPLRLLTAMDDWSKSMVGTMQVQAEAYRMAKAEGLEGDAMADRIQLLTMTPAEAAQHYLPEVKDEDVEPLAKSLAGENEDAFTDRTSEAWEQARRMGALKLAEDDGYTTDPWERASEKATELAFQEDIGPIGKGIQNARKEYRGLGFIFPFIKTMSNILRIGFRKTPLGSVPLLWRSLRMGAARMNWGGKEYSYSRTDFVRHAAEQLIAWGVFFALKALTLPDDKSGTPVMTGTVPFTPQNRGKRDLAYRTAPPQSIRIGDRWYSYARIEPFATGLAVTVDLMNAMEEKEADMTKRLGDLFTHLTGQLQEKTFAKGVADVMRAIQDGESAVEWVANFATSWVPNIIRASARESDGMVREAKIWGKGNDWRDRLVERTIYKALPLGALAPEPKVDLWGNEIRKDTFGNPASDFLARVMLPVKTVSVEKVQTLDRLLLNWNNQNPNDGYYPQAPAPAWTITRKGDRITVPMSDEQYATFLKLAGKMAAARLEVESLNVQHPTEADMKTITETIAKARGDARRKVWEARTFGK